MGDDEQANSIEASEARREADLARDAWARAVVAGGTWLLHTPSLTVGPAMAYFDGREVVHVSSVNGLPVRDPVIKLATGHAFLADRAHLVELTPAEVAFYTGLTRAMTELVRDQAVANAGAAEPVAGPSAMLLVTAALRAHLLALQPSPKPESF